METYLLEKDLKVFCVTADSFPEGILAAHENLHTLISFSKERNYFGLSRPNEKGAIVYKAAATELTPGEFEKLNLEPFVLKQGTYRCTTIKDYVKDMLSISKAFDQIIHSSGIDPQGICVEWYLNDKDVKCMVRLQPNL